MATITLENPYYYQDGMGGVSAIIGYDGHRRVARYEFTSPDAGVSHVSFSLIYAALQSKSSLKNMNFYIGTSASDHADAGEGSSYTGVVTTAQYQSYADCYTFSGEADIILMPNTKYYLWIFPSSEEGWCYYNAATITTKTVTTTGGAGLVYIDNGTGWDAYQVYIDNGTTWDLHMPYIDNGSSWDLYT
jgi:hypothetical protein